MIGDVAHMVVEIEFTELIASDLLDPLVHVGEMVGRWLGAMEAPNDHRHFADLTLRNPTDVILVIPGCDAGRSAEITPLDFAKGSLGRHLAGV